MKNPIEYQRDLMGFFMLVIEVDIQTWKNIRTHLFLHKKSHLKRSG